MTTLDVNIYSENSLEEIAEKVLEKTGMLSSSVDVIKLAQLLGLNVYGNPMLDGTDGFIKYEDNDRNIYVNSLKPVTRQRFTIAHEIAHYLLHRNLIDSGKGSALYRGASHNKLEQQANFCASALLMPRKALIDVLNNFSKNIEKTAQINILSKIFNVSTDAMSIRLDKLNLG